MVVAWFGCTKIKGYKVMFGKHNAMCMAIVSLLAGAALSPGVASADSRSEGFVIHDDYEQQVYNRSNGGSTTSTTRAGLPTNASKEDIQKYIKDSLNSNEGIGEDIKIAGKKQNDDGSYRVAITYYGSGNTQKNLVVEVGGDGSVTDANTSMTSQELQQAYDEIVYGGNNEMSVFDVIAVNDVLRSKSEAYFQNTADYLGVDAGTASKAAAEAMSLAGIVIMSAGVSPRQRKTVYESAYNSFHKPQAQPKSQTKADGTLVTSSDETGDIVRASSGVYEDYSDYGVSSLTPATQNFLNTLTTNFYNKTGIVLNVTSTLRPYDSGSYHSDGIAFDVANDEFINGANGYSGQELRDLYGAMARKMGGDPLDEYPGGEGVQFNRGYNYHVSVHNQIQWN